MKIWLVNRISIDLDGTETFYRDTKVFANEKRAREFYDGLCKLYYADEILDDDENGVVFYEEQTIPRKTTLTIEEKEIE